jgi:hypothetical protein
MTGAFLGWDYEVTIEAGAYPFFLLWDPWLAFGGWDMAYNGLHLPVYHKYIKLCKKKRKEKKRQEKKNIGLG